MSEAGDTTRRALLDAAQELLILKGVSGITTRKVADRAGVNQALVHYHFGTIEELLVAALERVSISVKERSEQIYQEENLVLGRVVRRDGSHDHHGFRARLGQDLAGKPHARSEQSEAAASNTSRRPRWSASCTNSVSTT